MGDYLNNEIKMMIEDFEDTATEFCLNTELCTSGISGNRYKDEITESYWVFWQRAWKTSIYRYGE